LVVEEKELDQHLVLLQVQAEEELGMIMSLLLDWTMQVVVEQMKVQPVAQESS
tara:strand:+ start:726 stop:884 length:159 start_codon:yes stop_codon:yes gene_type:complete